MVVQSSKTEAFVERLGEHFDRLGHQRIAGRLLGWLLICDPPHQAAAELEEATGASKASVSTNLKLLLATGLVERIGVPGERRAFYRVPPECWKKDLGSRLAEIAMMRRIAEEGLEALADAPPERRQRLASMHGFYAFFEREFPAMIERWQRQQGSS